MIRLQNYRQNVILFEDGITESLHFSPLISTGYQFHHRSLPLSLHFLFLSHKVPVRPFLSLMFFSQLRTEDRNRKMPVRFDCSVFLTACLRVCWTPFLLFFALLLSWYKVYKAASHFFLGPVKMHFLVKEHKQLPSIVPPMMNPVISFFLDVQNNLSSHARLPLSHYSEIMGTCYLRGGTNQKSSPDILLKLGRIKNRSLGCSKAPNAVKSLFYCCMPFTKVLLWLMYFVYIYLQILANISRPHLDHVLQHFMQIQPALLHLLPKNNQQYKQRW